MKPKLVWLTGLKGPVAQVWFQEYTRDMKPVKPLQQHELTEEQAKMNLDQLAKLFPYNKPEATECPAQLPSSSPDTISS